MASDKQEGVIVKPTRARRSRKRRQASAQFFRTHFKRWTSGKTIRRLKTPEWLKRLLLAIRDSTVWFGGQLVATGKNFVEIVLECLGRYPTTASVVIITAGLVWITSHVPVLAWLLMPVVSAVGCAIALSVFSFEAWLNARLKSAFRFMNR
jgi:hypothetical protein